MNDAERKRVEQLCRWVGNKVTQVHTGRINVYPCAHCAIPKYRKDYGESCPAANMKHACSTELIKYFTEVTE